MKDKFSYRIYRSWKAIQWEKYEKMFEILGPEPFDGKSILDIGIGFSWFEEFLREKGICWEKVLGIDPKPRKIEGVEYFDGSFEEFLKENEEKWDTVVCIDTYHLLEDKEKVWELGNIVIVALPLRFAKDYELKGEKFWVGGKENEVMAVYKQ